MTIAPMIAQATEHLDMLQRISAVPLMAMQVAERYQKQLIPVMQLIEEWNQIEEKIKRITEGPIQQAVNFIVVPPIDFPVFKEPKFELSALADINPWDDAAERDDDEGPQTPRRQIGFRFPPNY
ncbi:MAG: hypothetical protein ACHQWV_01605 [Nitrospirales bacterium]